MYSKDGPEKPVKVRYRSGSLPHPPSLTKPAGFLSRGRNVETLITPKHCAFAGRHDHSPTTRLELDARRGAAGIPEEEFRRESA